MDVQVYTSTEILFAKLQEELKRLQDWVALGTVDLDSFVDERLEEVSDWELNFKYLKVGFVLTISCTDCQHKTYLA